MVDIHFNSFTCGRRKVETALFVASDSEAIPSIGKDSIDDYRIRISNQVQYDILSYGKASILDLLQPQQSDENLVTESE